MSVGTLSMAIRGLVELERIYMNLVRYQHVESFQRGSLAPIRYVAQAARFVSLSTGFGF
jgi:hypothetical protein